METHPGTPEVAGETSPVDAHADPFEAMAAEWLGEQDQPEEAELEAEQPEAGEEAEEQAAAEEEADDLPPIEPPVSLTPEEKEAFKNLPREAQEFTARRIGDLEKGFNAKAQEAARARTEAEQAAIEQLTAIQRQYAQQYQQVAQQLQVQEPDPAHLATDPAAYAMQAHQYRHAQAQQQQLQHQAEQYAQQAAQYEAQLEQQRLQQEHALIVEHFPEYADPTTGPQLQQELSAVAREMGYSPELIAQARADDILAMRKAAEWKAKADQLDRLNKGKMEKVRAAKGLPKVATPGVAVSADATRQARAAQSFERAKNSSGGARVDAFADYLTSTGVLR